jgi:multiple sugar transport system substrate-binding protein
MQWSGLWALPGIAAALGDDFGVLPFPAAGPKGRPAVPIGAYGCAVNARSPRRSLAADYASWLWVRRTDYQQDFALSYGLHIPARLSLARSAARLRTGPAGQAVGFTVAYGHAAPADWTNRCLIAWQDALSRIIQEGDDPAEQIGEAAGIAATELDRVRAGG